MWQTYMHTAISNMDSILKRSEFSSERYFFLQAVFERLVDIICDKMSDSLDTDPALMSSGAKGTRLTDAPQGPQAANCNC